MPTAPTETAATVITTSDRRRRAEHNHSVPQANSERNALSFCTVGVPLDERLERRWLRSAEVNIDYYHHSESVGLTRLDHTPDVENQDDHYERSAAYH